MPVMYKRLTIMGYVNFVVLVLNVLKTKKEIVTRYIKGPIYLPSVPKSSCAKR